MDVERLTPAPWRLTEVEHQVLGESVTGYEVGHELHQSSAFCRGRDSATFICLARLAFDVMLRRGWFAIPFEGGWYAAKDWPEDVMFSVPVTRDSPGRPHELWPDPFTALVTADRWYREHVESKAGVAS